MARFVALSIFATLLGCAAKSQRLALARSSDPRHPLYVGTSQSGDIVVSASHADAVNGLAVAAADIGAKGDELLICKMDMLTGTHVRKWYCRYPSESERDRMIADLAKDNTFSQPHNCVSCAHRTK